MISNRVRLVALALLIAPQTATPAWAWGRLGHRVISRIAKKNLTPQARDAMADLLDSGETLADASTWADEHRRQLPKTAFLHYVDVPLDEPAYDKKWSADNPKKGCVVDKINEFKAVLKDKSKPVEERRKTLRFVIHFIEDMHMPMHVGENHDRGGNDTQVRYFDCGIFPDQRSRNPIASCFFPEDLPGRPAIHVPKLATSGPEIASALTAKKILTRRRLRFSSV